MDLAQPAAFDLSLAHDNIQNVRPGMRIFEVSAKTGGGMNELTEFISSLRKASTIATAV